MSTDSGLVVILGGFSYGVDMSDIGHIIPFSVGSILRT